MSFLIWDFMFSKFKMKYWIHGWNRVSDLIYKKNDDESYEIKIIFMLLIAYSPILYIAVTRIRNRNYIQKEMTPVSQIF